MKRLFDLILRLTIRSAWFNRAWSWLVYWYLSFRLKDHAVIFFNYGYQPAAAPTPLPLQPVDEPNRLFIQLYTQVIGGVSLQDKTVLEVSSGRGGGADYLARSLQPKRVIALERSPTAVAFCQRHYRTPNLTYVEGDAENLRFAPEAFDAVINIEASHCYSAMPRFVAEVTRVLRPGGHFLYADFRTRAAWAATEQALRHTGLVINQQQVINEPVMRAIEMDSTRRKQLVDDLIPASLRSYAYDFAAVKGTDVYEHFASGHFEYRAYALQKMTHQS